MTGAWLGLALLAGAQDRLDLWPEGEIPDFQPQQIAATTQEVRTPGFKAAEHTMPHLDWFEAARRFAEWDCEEGRPRLDRSLAWPWRPLGSLRSSMRSI